MKILQIPGSQIISHDGGMFRLLATVKNNNYSKEQLGYLVKFYGGDKILMNTANNNLFICETVEDAEYVEI